MDDLELKEYKTPTVTALDVSGKTAAKPILYDFEGSQNDYYTTSGPV